MYEPAPPAAGSTHVKNTPGVLRSPPGGTATTFDTLLIRPATAWSKRSESRANTAWHSRTYMVLSTYSLNARRHSPSLARLLSSSAISFSRSSTRATVSMSSIFSRSIHDGRRYSRWMQRRRSRAAQRAQIGL